ncbi:hypothetical protein B4O97_15035 [Marispirochaeta aestuarii]|uniref:2Fe-2S ferredoxin-type domain-containing protein n=1 Tax=Marispirochaeta aestuarii TaxID=1963862 RepID=A0A1Y1RV47_9SPIO|nr:2Fe-2S iron-sulfur cluster-binding protein [Marispirochaeta aestuarii]ORC32964.1 hypothetical protein B4O97_15035 [Marispirochaeta aestuarii]
MARLTVQPENRSYPLSATVSLLNTLLRNSHPIQHKCGGKTQCGTCRIRILEGSRFLNPVGENELNRLGQENLAAGLRLACQTFAYGDVSIEIPKD